MQDEVHAPNSCKTCRQRRVRCDRLLPGCQRCASSLLPCSGYDRSKQIVWTNSMASRGKMKGKTTFQVGSKELHGVPYKGGMQVSTDLLTNCQSLKLPLVDPDLRDIPESCRDYIRYFQFELSRECVVYNDPSFNPFLSLMPLMPLSQSLPYIMVAISAFHIAHRLVVSRPPLESSSSAVLHIALLNKQRALETLKLEIQVHPEMNNDAVIAAVLLFVNLDVVEFGGRGWRHHLKGAEELVRTRKLLMKDRCCESAQWLQYFDTACTTFGILGSTLAPSHSLSGASLPLDSTLLATLRRSEQQTWIGCPADLLSLLHFLNTLRAAPQEYCTSGDSVTLLLDGLDSFSPQSWANDFPDPRHHESRYHLAHAYKAAVNVYAFHIIEEVSSTRSSDWPKALRLIELGVSHMSQIQATDFHIKSLVWPAFVLGAGAQDLQTRGKVKNIMHNIWISSCCYNVRTASGMLDRIWEDEQGVNAAEPSWLRCIWERDESWLFL